MRKGLHFFILPDLYHMLFFALPKVFDMLAVTEASASLLKSSWQG